MSGARYAIYYAPAPGSALWRFGSAAIGYDAATGDEVACTPPPGFSPQEWHAATEEPRRYGFHATMKAPFHLTDLRAADGGADAAALARLKASFADFCRDRSSTRLAGLAVRDLDGFIALVPSGDASGVETLAQDCVEVFEPFRAPLSDADRARRLNAPLTERQIAQLDRYGYPYVGADFRFHMTLTGRLPDSPREAALATLAARFAGEVPGGSVDIDRLALFEQPNRVARFRIIAAHPLGAPR